jgi:hypothetical protein
VNCGIHSAGLGRASQGRRKEKEMPRFPVLARIGLLSVGALAFISPLQPDIGGASSHRDAPLITEDPVADNTDVYAFVSTQPGRQDYVTVIANYIPLEEPGDGPNYYRFSDNVLYEINIDVDGDARPDLKYHFNFDTRTVNGNTFLYNLGKIGPPPNPADPTSQYLNLNVQQSYRLTEWINGTPRTVLERARVAPIHVGSKSTGTPAEYDVLANAAIHTVGTAPKELRVFAGPRDEGFYVDLMGAFDLINPRNPGADQTSGFNVHTLAVEIPKSRLMEAGDKDGRIGVWATANRQRVQIFREDGRQNQNGGWAQVSRLANPLVNEVLIPLKAKDLYNATEPRDDERTIRSFIVDPATSQGPAALIPVLNSLTGCTPTTNRTDLELALLTGIPSGVIPGFAGNRETQKDRVAVADMIRLNYNIPPATTPNSLGLLGGDVAGFPNGRRVGDDVLDIDLKAAGGAILHVLGAISCPASLTLTDNVNGNDVPYLSTFPYLGRPHQGYTHGHDHS